MRGGRAIGSGSLCLLALLLALPGHLAAQGGEPQEGEEEPLPSEREMADAPRQFRISFLGSGLLWEEGDETRPTPDDGSVWGVDVERILVPWLSTRLSGTVGTSSVPDQEGELDLIQYLTMLHLVGRVPVAPLRKRGIVPFGTVGVGALIQDPDREGLATKSQNAFSFGAGLEVQPFERIGFRAEWRHLTVDLETLTETIDRTGENRDADRILGTVFLTF